MKYPALLVLVLLIATKASSQQPQALLATPEGKKLLDSERIANFYANRKYTFGVSESLYGSLAHYHPFGVFDITFSDRLTWLNAFNNASLEGTIGIGFEPYQGTRLHIGGDYELLSKANKFNMYMGMSYALGLAQATTMQDGSDIYVGYHNYLNPFIGFMYWPHKRDILDETKGDATLNRTPGFWQLFYFKFQVSYSFLVSSLQVDTTGAFDPHLYDIIKKNTANTLVFKIGIGINIPTLGKKRQEYNELRTRMREKGLY